MCTENYVLRTENIVLRTENIVLCTENIVLCTENTFQNMIHTLEINPHIVDLAGAILYTISKSVLYYELFKPMFFESISSLFRTI